MHDGCFVIGSLLSLNNDNGKKMLNLFKLGRVIK